MTDEELKERAKEFVSKSASGTPQEMQHYANILVEFVNEIAKEFEKENAELRKVAEFQQLSNMSRHFENKKLKDTLAVGSIWNKHLNAQNKALEADRDKYRNMVFDKNEQLSKAKKYIGFLLGVVHIKNTYNKEIEEEITKAEQFLKEVEND